MPAPAVVSAATARATTIVEAVARLEVVGSGIEWDLLD
jgi:hypothetical protein